MNKLLLIVSTNAVLIGALVILVGIYEAARWHINDVLQREEGHAEKKGLTSGSFGTLNELRQ